MCISGGAATGTVLVLLVPVVVGVVLVLVLVQYRDVFTAPEENVRTKTYRKKLIKEEEG